MLPGSNFAEEFRTLLFSKTFSDCTISIGHEKFFVHLALIEARAPGLHKIIAKAYVVVEFAFSLMVRF